MESLTIESIVETGQELNAKVELHPTSVIYIQTLVIPYVQTIAESNNVDDLKGWISQVFTGITLLKPSTC